MGKTVISLFLLVTAELWAVPPDNQNHCSTGAANFLFNLGANLPKIPLGLPKPPAEQKLVIRFGPEESDYGIALIYYYGEKIDEQPVYDQVFASPRSIVEEVQMAYSPDTHVGVIGVRGKFSHESLKELIPSDRRLLGGTRYKRGTRRPSDSLRQYPGEEAEDAFCKVEIG